MLSYGLLTGHINSLSKEQKSLFFDIVEDNEFTFPEYIRIIEDIKNGNDSKVN